MSDLNVLLALGTMFGILSLLFWLIVSRVVTREQARKKSPFTKTLLRSAGQSCAQKLDELNDKFWENLAMLVTGFAMASGIVMGAFMPAFKYPLTFILFGCAALAGATYVMVQIRQNIRERRNYRLGMEGERHTAQALQPLLAEGYELFHDLEFKTSAGETFNLDHVLLGPAGVIVVETKTRSKDADGKGSEATTVRYDGKQILYPKGPDNHGLEQVVANAKFLARELSAYTGERTFVRSAISLPGWFVTKTVREATTEVLNPEMLRKWVTDLPAATISTSQRNRIRGFLAKTTAG